jgi:hypothetical protein
MRAVGAFGGRGGRRNAIWWCGRCRSRRSARQGPFDYLAPGFLSRARAVRRRSRPQRTQESHRKGANLVPPYHHHARRAYVREDEQVRRRSCARRSTRQAGPRHEQRPARSQAARRGARRRDRGHRAARHRREVAQVARRLAERAPAGRERVHADRQAAQDGVRRPRAVARRAAGHDEPPVGRWPRRRLDSRRQIARAPSMLVLATRHRE